MTVDIYIREKNGNREIRVPWLPEKIKMDSGGTIRMSFDILNKGPVEIPTGSGLRSYSWASEFPGKYRTDTGMLRGTWQDPKTYHNILEEWKAKGTPLVLLVTGYPINDDVYVDTYFGEAYGAFGDWAYEVSFIEARDIVITSSKTSSGTSSSTTRPTTTTSQYTIKSGDTLWSISKRFLGSGAKWKTIYNANKDIIESTAKKRGKKSSNNGHWIFPGVTLTIPNQ